MYGLDSRTDRRRGSVTKLQTWSRHEATLVVARVGTRIDMEAEDAAFDSDDELNDQLGAAMKAIAAEKRRRDQNAEEMRPQRGVRTSWRRSVLTYVKPRARRKYVESWIVATDHWK